MNAYIIDAIRTPIGRSHKDKGNFRKIRADELLATLMRDLAKRVDPGLIDDVVIGCVGQHLEQGKNIARLAALLARYPETVPGVTINRLCASSLQAFNYAAASLAIGQGELILAGGVEHMDHLAMTAALDYNKTLLDRYEFPFTNMGLTAERVAEKHGITRQEQDRFALGSHRKAVAAGKAGWFDREIVAVTVDGLDGRPETITLDQCPREDTNIEQLGSLKTIFKENGTVTAGNSSPLNDGASLTLLASESGLKKHGLTPLAEIIDFTVVGLDPLVMGLGPIPAIARLLEKQRMSIGDIDLFEINEAFASQAIATIGQLDIPEDKVNIAGGAIALGHPLGCTGTRLIATLLNNLIRTAGEYGIVSMCIGHGQGIATMIRVCPINR